MKNYKLVYSQEFANGLTEILEYIRKESPHAAKTFERNVTKKIKLLKQFPEIWPVSKDTRLKGIRIMVIGNYLFLYEVISTKKLIYLHAFCHGARDYPHLYKNLSRG